MQSIILRFLLKMQLWYRQKAASHAQLVNSVQGFEGVLRMLADLDGDDALTLLSKCGAKMGSGNRVGVGLIVHNANGGFSHLSIGDDCHLGRQVFLDLAAPLSLGNRVTLSMRTTVLTHTDVGDSRCGIPTQRAGVRVEDDVYVGANATLLAGITISTGAVVAAGALVHRDVPAHTIVAGVPARPVGFTPAAGGRSNLGESPNEGKKTKQ